MARQFNRLSSKAVASKREPGYYADGGGLWLRVAPGGAKSWAYRFMLNGRAREMGLWSVHDRSLAEARDEAAKARRLLREGIDPIEQRQTEGKRRMLESARSMTFDQCAKAYIEAHSAGWRNPKHVAQWENTLATYCGPVFGKLPVQDVDVGLVLKVLEPLWTTKTETASRLRGRIESVLDWATTRKYREGENPARWKGHLDNLLPARSKVQKVEHQPALPYTQIAEFMMALRQQEGVAAQALELLILTAVRTQPIRFATWAEIDFEAKTWEIPATHMKAGRDHRVPLCDRALTILERMKAFSTDEASFIFPGGKRGKPMSDAGMLALLRRMNADARWVDGKTGEKIVPHGFRSTFRDWAAESTNYPREVCEMALAHTVGNQVEAAYRRGDLFEKRRLLMTEWAQHCEIVEQGKVLALRPRKDAAYA